MLLNPWPLPRRAHPRRRSTPWPSYETHIIHGIPDDASRAGARTRRAWLRGADCRAVGRARPRRYRPRSAGVGADRLRQDRRIRTGARHQPARLRGTDGADGSAAGADRGADARTGHAGLPRADVAVRVDRRPRHHLRRRHGRPRRSPPTGGRPAYRRRHAGAAARPSGTPPPGSLGLARRRSGRSRRDARPRLPRGSGVHSRCNAHRAAHAAVLGDRAARHRDARQALPA